LDRDGTLNVKAPEGHYICSPSQVELVDGAREAVGLLRTNFELAIVTNQRGIALGLMTEEDLRAVHARLFALLGLSASDLLAVKYCPHERESCACRKPRPGMLLEVLAENQGLGAGASVLIGDSPGDIEAGRAAGLRTIRIARDADARATVTAPTLLAAAEAAVSLLERAAD
jgi:D-glycero-D-manno-heptose 1,7-bisphosphate phosphatase